MNSKHVYISNGKRPIWHTLLAAFFFTASLFICYLVFFEDNIVKRNRDYGDFTYLVIFSFMLGIHFSQVIDYQFDFEKMEYKKIRVFGFLKFSKSYPFEHLQYIAVFQKQDSVYEINLWYGNNKHFLISAFEDSKAALMSAGYISEKLQLDLWDATNPHDGFWVDKNNLLELD